MLSWVFGSRIKELQTKIEEQQRSINEYVVNLDRYQGKIPEYCTIQGGVCTSTGVLLWEKDLEHRYTYMNMRHSNEFFNTSYADYKKLLGKTDYELITQHVEQTGKENTFASICIHSDQYILKNKQLSRFWEIGYVNSEIVILDTMKQPLFDSKGKIKGTRGWASLLSERECEIKTLIEIYLKLGTACRIDDEYDNGSACYLIVKENNKFNRHFLK